MTVHRIETTSAEFARSKYPNAAILRPIMNYVLVFDRVDDAFGHETSRPAQNGSRQ